MASRIVVAPAAAQRLDEAAAWLKQRKPDEELLIVAHSLEAASSLVHQVTRELPGGAAFGWRVSTLPRVASSLAGPVLAARGLTVAGHLVLEAMCARIVYERARTSGLGRFQPIADRPGLVRAIARTIRELRAAGVTHASLAAHDGDLAPFLESYERALEEGSLADRAVVLRTAAEVARTSGEGIAGVPLLLLDTPIENALEGELVAVLSGRAPEMLTLAQDGDARTIAFLSRALSSATRDARTPEAPGALGRLQARLFDPRNAEPAPIDERVVVVSAPGESRECVEIARRILREAARGVPFDRMAVLLRSPAHYRAHVLEAFRRAQIPVHFAGGVARPDPAGRAFLALLACAAEQLSARRFAEYLSLGQVPDRVNDGSPPDPPPSESRWVRADDELLPRAIARVENEPNAARDDDTQLPSPRRWENLLVEAAVIGGRDRWVRRLDGLRRELELDLGAIEDRDPDAPRAIAIRRSLSDLGALRAFALPLLEALDSLPQLATWSVWLDTLTALATRALRRPQRVLSVLSELAPMGPVGPVDLHEIRIVLTHRLRDLLVAPETHAAGRVFCGDAELARGLSFDVVFVPGLAEKIFPQKVVEDPILRDAARARLGAARLEKNDDRIAEERLALRIAVGAARERVILSYPRIDLDQSRPRVPSFYGLEVLRAAEGTLYGFEELTRRAEHAAETDGAAATRLGWPAPRTPNDAIDEAEHDLALLSSLLHRPASETKGTARYLLDANVHLARALRARARRWIRRWTPADGLVDPPADALAALQKHALGARSYSPTALQNFAACPYRFLLQAIHRLSPREVPEPIEELDPLQRGSLVHEVLYELLVGLREDGRLPLHESDFDFARDRLDEVVERVANRFRDELAPAIDRVWDDGIASIRADVREWLVRGIEVSPWAPWKFELSFGLADRRAQDPASVVEPVVLESGLRLRGSIDLVERHEDGALRATDYKTGKPRADANSVIGGGETLQPVLYALALERMFPEQRVAGGRLYYCTSAGEYKQVDIQLDDYARRAAGEVVSIVGDALTKGFLPAAPKHGACEYCDYRPVCGPHEEQRTAKKASERLVQLRRLREMP